MLWITADQMSSAAGYLTRNWGDHGYRIEKIESPTALVSVFHVVAGDGARFAIAADKWGNCRHLDTHGHDADSAPLAELVRDMHAKAFAA